MQLVGQNVEGVQVEGSPRSVSEGEGGPVSPTSSSPGSPTAAAGTRGAEAGATGGREKPGRVLPCPRCQSMNTKFCYYNNYSVAQPRHFCRQCQRYWTAGGTLRNVPVGGGSRKKNRRAGEPYQQQQQRGPFGVPAAPPPQQQHQQQQNVGGFQQMLAQDGNLALNFPGFYNPGYNNVPDPQSYAAYAAPEPMHAMYGTAPAYYEMAPESAKPDLWMMPPPPPPPQQPQLNLGLNRWPDPAKHVVGSSPPHGSSTIEEEGSTPANAFSARGYEEGDSMWPSLHVDSDAMFQESMFQLSNPEDHR